MSLKTRMVEIELFMTAALNMLSKTNRKHDSLREDIERLEIKLDVLIQQPTPPCKCAMIFRTEKEIDQLQNGAWKNRPVQPGQCAGCQYNTGAHSFPGANCVACKARWHSKISFRSGMCAGCRSVECLTCVTGCPHKEFHVFVEKRKGDRRK